MKTLPSIIGHEQKAYTKRLNISEGTANIIEIIDKLNRANRDNHRLDAFMVFIDWRKAFDSMHHAYLIDCLKAFGFPQQFINIIRNWMSNRKSCILLDGKVSEFFDILRGVAQGDAISGYIFLIAIENGLSSVRLVI